MRKIMRKGIAYVLTIALLAMCVPAMAFGAIDASNDEDVIKSATHSDGDVSVDGKDITITVPYGHTAAVDANALKINWEPDAVTPAMKWDAAAGSVAVDGTASGTVTYYVGEDKETAYTSTYTVAVKAKEAKRPEVSGSISKTVKAGKSVSFSSSDFTDCYSQNNGKVLEKVIITEKTNPVGGKMTLNGSDYIYGDDISVGDFSKLAFYAGQTGTATYKAAFYETDNSTAIDSVTITVKSEAPSLNTVSAGSITQKETVKFPHIKLNAAFKTASGSADSLTKAVFTSLPGSSTGTLYQGYTSSSSTGTKVATNTDYDAIALGDMTFVPNSSFAGDAEIGVTVYDTNGLGYTGTVTVTVTSSGIKDITGTVSVDGTYSIPYTTMNSEFKAVNGSGIEYVTFTNASSVNNGNLYYNSSSRITSNTAKYYYTGSSSRNYLSKVTFSPSDSGSTTINYRAYDSSGNYNDGKITLTINSSSYELKTITYTVDSDSYETFTLSDFTSALSKKSNYNLDYVKFTLPSSSYGVLYYDYKSSGSYDSKVSASSKYYRTGSSKDLVSKVSFVPKSSYDGTVSIKYTAYDTNDDSYTGLIKITVDGASTSGDMKNITYSVDQDSYKTFSVSDFTSVLNKVSNYTLSYVKFTLPSSSYGVLYYDYTSSGKYDSKVSASSKYYRSGSGKELISDVTFVPKSSYDGTVSIKYTAYDTDGDSYDGVIKITVDSSSSSADLKNITYTVADDSYKTFSVSDFTSVLSKESNYNLDYVKFTLPSSSYGVLYYDYKSSGSYDSKVSASSKYYRTGSSKELISDVTFVPKSGYDGTASIKYTAYDTDGDSYTGIIKITVNADSSASLANIEYSVTPKSVKTFAVSDFTGVLSKKSSSKTLNYIKFTLPSSTYGTLYYNYTSSTSTGSKVNTSTKYYRTGSNELISKVTFVPNSSFTGTFYINYTAYDSSNNDYSGKIKMTVGSTSLSSLSYSTLNTTPITISATDIDTKFRASNGSSFNYLKFTIPSSTYGTLYFGYTSASNKGTAVTANDMYYRTGSGTKLVSNVTFVPNSSYTGTFNINYTAYGTNNASYSGAIQVTLTKKAETTTSVSSYFKDITSDYTWASKQVDYLYNKGVVKGTSTDSSGMMYSPKANITRGDFMLMLYRSFGLTGTFTENFSDVDKNSYYYQAIGVAKALGIAQGADGKFSPTSNLTRQDAVVLINRAITVTGKKTLTASTDLTKFSDRTAIASYAQSATGTLVKAGVISGYADGTFKPEGKLTRAEMAVVLYKVEML